MLVYQPHVLRAVRQNMKSSELEKYTVWNQKRTKGTGYGGFVTIAKAGGYRMPQRVVDSILKDAQSGEYRSKAEVGRANNVSAATVRNYLVKYGIELKTPTS